MSTRLLTWDGTQWRGGGVTPITPGRVSYGVGNESWRLRPGETLLDGLPTSATVVDVGDITGSRDLSVILNAADSISVSGPIYLQLDEGAYDINTLANYGTSSNPNWIGYANSNRKVLGLIGAGFTPDGSDFLTRIVAAPTMVSSTPNCRDFVLAATKTTFCPVTSLYLSNTSSAAPFFISGISFDGNLQSPAGVYTPEAQGAFVRNQGATSPLAWNGISLVRAQPGSRFQNCRFRGYGFALNSAPPFECGCINTNYSNMTVRGIEVDGRVPAYLNASRPRASAAWMLNKELDIDMIRVWEHHTRRSGNAANTNTNNPAETYRFEDCVFEQIANVGDDGWPSDISTLPGGFNGFNIEGITGTYTAKNTHVNSEHSHVNWALPYSTDSGVITLPDRIIVTINGFTTDDTSYGGLLRFSTSRQPNSTGISAIWSAINANMDDACSRYIDVRKVVDGPRLQPVRASQFNASVHKADTHYLLRSF